MFLVSVAVYAATTVGTNISTDGTVTMESASTTNDFWLGNVIADDDDSLFFDASGTEYIMWDDDPGEFDFSDDLNIVGVTTSTLAFWAGAGGTVDNINMTGGDVYVQNDVEIDGALYLTGAATVTGLATFDRATSTSATTTDYLYIGPDGAEGTFDFSGGDLYVADDVEIEDVLNVAGLSTFTGFISTASSTVDANLNITGNSTSTNATTTGSMNIDGDLQVDGTADITGAVTVTGLATFDKATSTSATTTDYLYIGPDGTEDFFDFSGGDLYVADDAEVEDDLNVGGFASSTGDMNTQANAHVGGTFDVDGTAALGGGNAITKFMFGTCDIATVSVSATSTAFIECTSATGVQSGDNVFVTATSSLPENFIIQAASSTVSDEISLRIFNAGSIEGTDTGARTFFWQAMR